MRLDVKIQSSDMEKKVDEVMELLLTLRCSRSKERDDRGPTPPTSMITPRRWNTTNPVNYTE